MVDVALTIEFLDKRAVAKKRRRYAEGNPASLATIPGEWRELLLLWLRRGGNSRWETLLKDAGLARKSTAETLLDWLLRHAWVVVDEERRLGDWWPYRIELRHIKALRSELGLPDEDDIATRWKALRASLQAQADQHSDDRLLTVLDQLDAMPIARAISRAELVTALLNWAADERSGTYRDFSLYARAATKEISVTEWQWLDSILDLAAFNIEQHIPLLLISADVKLRDASGEINLAVMPDFAALTPATIKSMYTAESKVTSWLLVENRTSFERVAKRRQAHEGVIWLPGYPPGWWREAVAKLIAIAPAPARIACDPDPAGIAIALSAIQLWQVAGLGAAAWKMGVAEMHNLAHTQKLTENDKQHLNTLLKQKLPEELQTLAEYLVIHQQKGEQEGYL